LYFDSTTNNLYICSGSPSTWVAVGGGAGGYWDVSPSDPNNIYNTNSGNVGIGTANPAGKLHVVDNEIPGNTIDDDGDGVTDETDGLMVFTPTGRVGIGRTINLAYPLEVTGDIRAWGTGVTSIHIRTGGTGTSDNAAITFTAKDTQVPGARIRLFNAAHSPADEFNINNIIGPITFSNGVNERVRITDTGNVGIGTTNPTVPLQVNGPVSGAIKIVDGNQVAGRVLTSDANGLATWQAAGGGGTQFGVLQTKSNNNVYLAATDGFVMAGGSGYFSPVVGLVGTSASPTTKVAQEQSYTNTIYVTIIFPVQKNNYWKVTGASTVYWQPTGS
jgi:hypothetical protein